MYRQQPESMDSNSTKVSEYPSSLLTSRVQWSLRDYGPARKKTRIPFKRSSLSFSLSLSRSTYDFMEYISPGNSTISFLCEISRLLAKHSVSIRGLDRVSSFVSDRERKGVPRWHCHSERVGTATIRSWNKDERTWPGLVTRARLVKAPRSMNI